MLKMEEISQNSQKLLDLCMCKEDRQRPHMRHISHVRLRDLDVLQAEPSTSREQPQAPMSSQVAAARQDPAILDIQKFRHSGWSVTDNFTV